MLHLAKPDRSRWDDRKLDHVRPYLDGAQTARRFGVVAIVAAQEFQWVYSATKKTKGELGAGEAVPVEDSVDEAWGSAADRRRSIGVAAVP